MRVLLGADEEDGAVAELLGMMHLAGGLDSCGR